MRTFLKPTALAIIVGGFALAGPAFADGAYTGPNGGTASWQGDCYGGHYRAACHREWTATGPQGNTYSGGATAWRGPWHAGVTRSVTGPDGGVAYGGRLWRRW